MLPHFLADKFDPSFLAPHETEADFLALTETLHHARAMKQDFFHRQELEYGHSPTALEFQEISGLIICWFVPAKPPDYVSTMQSFRSRFSGIAHSQHQRGRFEKLISPAALAITSKSQLRWEPQLYFSLDEPEEYGQAAVGA